MAATLYVLPSSHPSVSAELMLRRKGIEYKRVDLMPIMSKGILRAMRFGGVTVPALKIDGRRIQGSTEIARELDRIRPEPPLYPGDAEQRTAVEAAERWGEQVLQNMARRILWNATKRDSSSIRSYLEGYDLPIPTGLAVKTSAPIIAASARFNKATDDNARADLAALPGALDRIDDWIAEGVLGGGEPNAADYQIAPSLMLLMTLDDLRPAIESRPAGEMAKRVVPSFPGHSDPVLPSAWLEPLRAAAPTAG